MTRMSSSLKGMAITAILVFGAATAFAHMGKVTGAGEVKLPSNPLIENALLAQSHGALITTAKAAGIGARLERIGRYTLFAPSDDAFDRLPAGTVPALLKRQNIETLKDLLAYHIVPGVIDRAALSSLIKAQGGEAALTTIEGGTLRVKLDEQGGLYLTDEQGNMARLSAGDVYQSNSVVHVIDGVLMRAVKQQGQSS